MVSLMRLFAAGPLLLLTLSTCIFIQRASAFSPSCIKPVTLVRIQATKITDWSKLESPPVGGGSRTGPNWSVDPVTLNPRKDESICGTLTWAIGENSSIVYPERRMDLPVGKWLARRHNLGIAMSGGGLRAATCALGWLRALNHLGILPKARYFAANSGGTWTAQPFFSKQILDKKEKKIDISYDAYLGKYVAPQSITMDDAEYGIIGDVLQKSNVKMFKDKDNPAYNDWCASIRQNYFSPVLGEGLDDFWLDLFNAHFWNNQDILNDYHTLPFPIYVASCYEDAKDGQIFPFEMTAFYTGIPVKPSLLFPNSKLGGGFIQGVGFNAPSTKDKDPIPVYNSSHYLVDLDKPSPVVKLFELTGASSNFVAAAEALTSLGWLVEDIGVVLKSIGVGVVLKYIDVVLLGFVPRLLQVFFKDLGFLVPGEYKFWSPNKGGEDTARVELVDGGLLDNLGVIALLRRNCSTIIACNAADSDVAKVGEKEWQNTFSDVALLFGLKSSPPLLLRMWEKKPYSETIALRSQIFEKGEFVKLMKDLLQCEKDGKPLVVRKTMTVLVNHYAGIFESYPVDMIWCFNSQVDNWDSHLSDAAKHPSEVDKKFPYYDTFNTDYSKNDVNKLAHLCSYQLVHGLPNVNFEVDKVPY